MSQRQPATLLDHAPVLWRHRTQQAIWRLAAASLRGFRHTLDEQGFTELQTPKLVGSSTESGANVFVVDYFGRSAYLAQSPQFYKQIMVGVFERVVSLDAEVGFITDHRDVLSVLRDVVAGVVVEIRRTAAEDAKLAGADLPEVPDEIPIVHFRDALGLVGADRGEPAELYESYLQTFRHGMQPHGGFALGLEQWTARLIEADNIRQTTLFPRDLHRLTP